MTNSDLTVGAPFPGHHALLFSRLSNSPMPSKETDFGNLNQPPPRGGPTSNLHGTGSNPCSQVVGRESLPGSTSPWSKRLTGRWTNPRLALTGSSRDVRRSPSHPLLGQGPRAPGLPCGWFPSLMPPPRRVHRRCRFGVWRSLPPTPEYLRRVTTKQGSGWLRVAAG
jgi:hypothetical protein